MRHALYPAYVARDDGSELFIGKGHLYPDDDPIVVAHPAMFADVEEPAPGPRTFYAADEPDEPAPVEDQAEEPDVVEAPALVEEKPGTRRGRAARGEG
jgi:hypothetical protein